MSPPPPLPDAGAQADVLAFLADPASHGLAGEAPEIVETHISFVVLIDGRAFKLKRARKLAYLDFSTLPLRLAACERELALNRRTAPRLYRAVRRITREADGRLAFDGKGPLVDAVVEMERFDQETLFDRMALSGRLDARLMGALGAAIAHFHGQAEIAVGGLGGAANMAHVLSVNERAFAGTRVFGRERLAAFNAAFRAALDRHAALLDARQRDGKVRRCHGDLHLRNICMFEGRPTLFDCIEFNEQLATVDVLYDLAFLLMDLWHRDLRGLANVAFNRYLDARDETDGIPLLPLFMAIRAAVRAHIAATLAGAHEGDEARSLAAEAEAYFTLALDLLRPADAMLVAIGGRSGTGKSSLAAAIAEHLGPAPGARVLSSDRTRKRYFGVEAETRLPADAYRPEVSSAVYGRLFASAEAVATMGHGVIADAVFDRAPDRAEIAARADAAHVPFTGFWLEAPESVLVARVDSRRADPSDATADIVRGQLARDPGEIGWHRLDARRDLAETAAAALRVLDGEGKGP